MLKFGIITEVDAAKGVARVQFPDQDGMVSSWLPMSVPRTLKDKFSIPYDVTEHVWCLMDDNLEFGVIGGAIYSAKDSAPGGVGAGNVLIKFDDGLSIEYERQTRILTVSGDGDVKINVPAGNVGITCLKADVEAVTEVSIKAPVVTIDSAAVSVTGLLNVAGVMTAGGIATGAPAGGNTGDAVITGKLVIAGDIEATGDVKSGNINLKTHKHGGVQPGGGVTSTPVP